MGNGGYEGSKQNTYQDRPSTMETQTDETYDYAALEERILDYFNFIRSTALRYSNDFDRAEDFAQEVAYRIIKAKPNHATLGPKYFREATVTVIKYIWRTENSTTKPNLALYDVVPDTTDCRFNPEDSAVFSETISRVKAVCTTIEWEAIVLKAEGYSLSEIAEELGVSKWVARRMVDRVIAKAKDNK